MVGVQPGGAQHRHTRRFHVYSLKTVVLKVLPDQRQERIRIGVDNESDLADRLCERRHGILRLVRVARPDAPDSPLPAGAVAWGPGPRASQALSLAARARALLDGRLSPSLDDVATLAPAVLRHRMALSYAAEVDEGLDIDQAITRLIPVIA